jgi:hypothetical protein
MACNLRKRQDDIPKKNKREKTWFCNDCGVLLFSEAKPVCRRVMLAQVQARVAFAEVEAQELHLDEKDHP